MFVGCFDVFIITDNTKSRRGGVWDSEEVEGVGVVKDEDVKLQEIGVSHTLGGSERCYVSVCERGGVERGGCGLRRTISGCSRTNETFIGVVYYESRKRELKIWVMNESRCDERLNARVEESTCLTYTGLHRSCLLYGFRFDFFFFLLSFPHVRLESAQQLLVHTAQHLGRLARRLSLHHTSIYIFLLAVALSAI